MRPTLIAGNWKMNGSRSSVAALTRGIVEAGPFGCQAVLIPSFVFLDPVGKLLSESSIALGAQDVDLREDGAVTGAVSAAMVADAGCDYALVGHSERRTLFDESDEEVAQKFAACLKHGIRPILCVGERLEEREAGTTMAVVDRQLDTVLAMCGIEGFASAVVAYEPVWAIGTGRSASAEQAQAVHAGIRDRVASHDRQIADSLPLLYGGSVKADNVAELVGQKDIDGALVGGASLKADEFVTICEKAAAESAAG